MVDRENLMKIAALGSMLSAAVPMGGMPNSNDWGERWPVRAPAQKKPTKDRSKAKASRKQNIRRRRKK